MREQTCCFTGHRELSGLDHFQVERCLENELEKLIRHGVRFFGCGGAQGFDTLAAHVVIQLKQKYPHIRLILVLPYRVGSKQYDALKPFVDKIDYTAQSYSSGCMHKRNRHLVDFSSYCICYLTKNSGGTYYTVQYAKRFGLNIINLADLM